MTVPVVLCAAAPWSIPADRCPPVPAWQHAVERPSWRGTAFLCGAPRSPASTLSQLLSAHHLSAHPLPTHAPGASGCVLHSTGLHLARARAWLHAFAEHAPTVWQGARDAMAEARPVPPSGPGLAATTLHPPPDPAHPVDTRIT